MSDLTRDLSTDLSDGKALPDRLRLGAAGLPSFGAAPVPPRHKPRRFWQFWRREPDRQRREPVIAESPVAAPARDSEARSVEARPVEARAPRQAITQEAPRPAGRQIGLRADDLPRDQERPTETRREDARKQEAKPRIASRRPLWQSPLTRRILAVNMLALAIPVVGLLYIDSYRSSLIQSELDLLQTEAKLFSGAIAAGAVVTDPSGEDSLLPEATRQTVRRMVDVSKTRARIFAPDGALLADSFLLSGPGGIVEIQPLPPPEPKGNVAWSAAVHAYNWVLALLPSGAHLPIYAESAIQTAADYPEVQKALNGETGTFVRDAGNGAMVLSVAVPVQRYRQVLGALFLTKSGESVEATLRDTRLTILSVFGLALSVTVLLSFYLASTIALPIHRLADAADRVRRSKGRKVTIPDLTKRQDEVGDLSGSLREMTQAVWMRMDAIERFAADVAHEIKNPLTSLRSAVETVARIEDPLQQKKLMSIILDDVQRLNRLISDISDASRIDAEMSRAETGPVDLREMLQAMADIHQATMSRTAPRLRLDLPLQADLRVLGTEGRLGQVLRNLISNAVSFSPAGGEIALAAQRRGRSVVVMVDDQGPGIPPDKLTAIFERFYSERPKGEKFGTHSGLGLSISKQIVEAHGGTLMAENLRDEDGRVQGARFTLTLPAL
ncbi:MAG TPA: stimulus-sensing domain-containing protein [Terriglobales bacterium]|nr:stimulus-sensing domain-containing protein [Terriglobales bacterium]